MAEGSSETRHVSATFVMRFMGTCKLSLSVRSDGYTWGVELGSHADDL